MARRVEPKPLTPLPPRQCDGCESSFQPKTPHQRFCSVECRTRPCETCQKPIDQLERRARFCSVTCMGAANAGGGNPNFGRRHPGMWEMPGEIRARMSDTRVGPGNPAWTGGSKHNGHFRFQAFVSRWCLENYPTCPCGAPATEVQHVIPRRWFADVRMANFAENLLGMCLACHRPADGRALRMSRRGRAHDLLHAERLPESILVQLRTDGSVSRLPKGLDWSPLGNVAEEVLRPEWFDTAA